MEVLSSARRSGDLVLVNSEELGGTSLVKTVVSLTDLPETLIHEEMDQILQASGHRSESLTIDQLRIAMLSYLESIQADFEAAGETGDDSLTASNDATAE